MGSRNTKALLLILAASLLAGRRPLAAQTPLRLSFADAVRVASSETPAVALAALRTDEADARVREARGALLPSLSLGGSWLNRTFNSKTLGFDFSFPLPGGGTASLPDLIGPFNVYDARFSAAQTLFDWSSVTRVKAAGAQADGSRAEHGATVERSAVTAAVAYVQAVRAAALVDARRADSTLAAELATLAQAQKAAGVSAAIDLTRAQVQLTVAQGQLLVARNQADGARIDLTRALGLDPATPFTLTDTLAPSLGVAAVAEERDSAISTALANRPDLRVEQAHGVAARRTGSAIRAERLPRLAVVGDYGVSGRTVPQAISTYDLSVHVSISILDGFRREARLDEQDAVARESQVRETDLRRQIGADVDAALLDLRSAEAGQRIATEGLRLAREEVAQARERFRSGVAGNIDVITAQQSLIRARDADIGARYATVVARVSLARAAGIASTLH